MAQLAQNPARRAAAALWQARLQDFVYDCVGSAPSEQADRIREASSLFRQATARERPDKPFPEEWALEAMLASGAYESAVLTLLDCDSAFMLSRGGNGSCLATMSSPGRGKELTAEASTLALALLAAQASVLLAVSQDTPG